MSDRPVIPFGDGSTPSTCADSGAIQRHWRKPKDLSRFAVSLLDWTEDHLASSGFDRAPWIAVFLLCGIMAWFALDSPGQWIIVLVILFALGLAAIVAWHGRDDRWNLRQALIALAFVTASGICLIWARSELVGAEPIAQPSVESVQGYVLAVEHQPSRERTRITLAVRDWGDRRALKVRVNSSLMVGRPDVREGAIVRLRAHLMPPAAPFLPGGYDFARAAWFQGLAATGRVIGDVEVVATAEDRSVLAGMQRSLSQHIRKRIDGSPGTIAAAFASGDRGAIAKSDQEAMRDAGLTHLLAISGLHVSAVIAAAYLLTVRLLGLFPAIALRIRLPLVGSLIGAGVGIGYTLLTGAQVPTVRSCAAAMLVLIALALGRDALSLRMVACAAVFVMALWPESVIGPSFQMSFAAVIAIVALHTSKPARVFLAPRDEAWTKRWLRNIAMLFLTGLVIELALMPVVLFHFHRAGLYGAFANVLAIPLVTFCIMPLIALALVLDLLGLGAPFWWLADGSLTFLLEIAHRTAELPGSVKTHPAIDQWVIALIVSGGLWLALWSSFARLLGALPIAAGVAGLIMTPSPDILIGRQGHYVAIIGKPGQLLMLRNTRSSYAHESLVEMAGSTETVLPIERWPGSNCSSEFCSLILHRDSRSWTILIARNRIRVEERALSAACERSDIVIADRWLPRSCRPRWLKADRSMLDATGGTSIYLEDQMIRTVAAGQGSHGWWQGDNYRSGSTTFRRPTH